MAVSRARRDDSLMDREAIAEAFNNAVEEFLTDNFSIAGLIGRLGGGEGGKRQLVDLWTSNFGGKAESNRRNINRWLLNESGRAGEGRAPGAASISRLHRFFLATARGISINASGTFTDYDLKRSAYREINVNAPNRNALASFVNSMLAGDTAKGWDGILDWYGVFPGALIPEPGEVEVDIHFE